MSRLDGIVDGERIVLTLNLRLLCEKDFLLSMVPEPAMGKFPKLKRYVQFQRERAEHLATRKQTRGSRAQRGAERKKAQ